MKRHFLLYPLAAFSLSCQRQAPENKKPEGWLENIEIINKEDPVCLTKTTEALNDTARLGVSIYGFCSTECKEKFLEEPEAFGIH